MYKIYDTLAHNQVIGYTGAPPNCRSGQNPVTASSYRISNFLQHVTNMYAFETKAYNMHVYDFLGTDNQPWGFPFQGVESFWNAVSLSFNVHHWGRLGFVFKFATATHWFCKVYEANLHIITIHRTRNFYPDRVKISSLTLKENIQGNHKGRVVSLTFL